MYLIDSKVPVTGFVSNSSEWKPNTSVFLMTISLVVSFPSHTSKPVVTTTVGRLREPGAVASLARWNVDLSLVYQKSVLRSIDDIANCSICFLTSREVLINFYC